MHHSVCIFVLTSPLRCFITSPLSEGVNGQLPNLDLVNTVVRVARITSQIPVTLHDERVPTIYGQAALQESYISSLKSMLYTMRYQALGHPTGDHGLYLRYVEKMKDDNLILIFSFGRGFRRLGLRKNSMLV